MKGALIQGFTGVIRIRKTLIHFLTVNREKAYKLTVMQPPISLSLLLFLPLIVRVDIVHLIHLRVVSFQQIKREKALKDELVRELESKELEMQLLLQRQKSVSPRIFLLEYTRFPLCCLNAKLVVPVT